MLSKKNCKQILSDHFYRDAQLKKKDDLEHVRKEIAAIKERMETKYKFDNFDDGF